MNYLNDLRFINRHMSSERRTMAMESTYWNNFESALKVLTHSRHVNRDEVFRLAREAMLKDIGAAP